MKNNRLTPDEIKLIAHIKAQNAETLNWVAEDPKNRWAVTIVEDIEHWRAYGIHTVEAYDHYMLASEAYDSYKSVYGHRCDYRQLNAMTDQELREFIQKLEFEAARIHACREAEERVRVQEFENDINRLLNIGASDRYTAINWIIETYSELKGEYQPDYVLFTLGLPDSYREEIANALL